MNENEQITYLAGWLEGEGWFGPPPHATINPHSPKIEAASTDRDTLERIHQIFGGVLMDKQTVGNRKQAWKWQLNGWPALIVMDRIFPYMSARRQERILSVMEMASQGKLGQTRIICRNGHNNYGPNRRARDGMCKVCVETRRKERLGIDSKD